MTISDRFKSFHSIHFSPTQILVLESNKIKAR